MEVLKAGKKKPSTKRTVHVSVRAPENVIKAINLLVDLGLFKDKSDFINYALQETVRKYLSSIKLEITPELIDKYFELLEKASPRLSEEEILKVLGDVLNERRTEKETQEGSG
ncbi:hypothetical protein NF865_02020 [Thermococcus aggregans]|uniref:Uncharacterized protein n=1 Tax=Thermococcus aggregans TaxID=110163 RepID=A0A9E7SP32_THEAG|nr:hypothetical protein [Thermococcus aggregans]USS41019.1 hypothetical protein NF865_02020 [Thermococcus aggregans]